MKKNPAEKKSGTVEQYTPGKRVLHILFLWFKLVSEPIFFGLMFYIFFVLPTGSLIEIGETHFECRIIETALFRAPGFTCMNESFIAQTYELFVQGYYGFSTPLLSIYFMITVMGEAGEAYSALYILGTLIISVFIVMMFGKEMKNLRLKFPIFFRNLLYILKSFFAYLYSFIRKQK